MKKKSFCGGGTFKGNTRQSSTNQTQTSLLSYKLPVMFSSDLRGAEMRSVTLRGRSLFPDLGGSGGGGEPEHV